MDDVELLTAWRGGDAQAGRTLVGRHFDAVYRFFVNKVPAQAEDLVQDTFLAAVEARDHVRDAAAFRAYLFGVARRRLYRFWRDRKGGDPGDASVSDLGAADGGAAEALAQHQEQKLLLAALRRLPLPVQILLELAYFEGMTDRELAEVEGIPVGTLKSRLRKARADLAAVMETVHGGEVLASTKQNFEMWVRSVRAHLQAGARDRNR